MGKRIDFLFFISIFYYCNCNSQLRQLILSSFSIAHTQMQTEIEAKKKKENYIFMLYN